MKQKPKLFNFVICQGKGSKISTAQYIFLLLLCFVFSSWTPIMRNTSNILVPLREHQFYLSRWKSPLQKVQASSSPHCLQEAASKHSGELVSEPAELQACESLRQKRNSDNFRGAEKPIWKTLFLDRRTDQIFLLHCTKNRPECMILVHSYSHHDSKKKKKVTVRISVK